jgi:hypothetical protein
MSLAQYAKLQKILSSKNDTSNKIEQIAQVFIQDVKQLTNAQLIDINDTILTALQEKPKFKPLFRLGLKLYGFEPDLKNMPYGAYLDIKAFEEQGMYNNLHEILAILYRPAKKFFNQIEIDRYEGESERADLFLNKMPADVAAGALFFFTILKTEYEIIFRGSQQQQATPTA